MPCSDRHQEIAASARSSGCCVVTVEVGCGGGHSDTVPPSTEQDSRNTCVRGMTPVVRLSRVCADGSSLDGQPPSLRCTSHGASSGIREIERHLGIPDMALAWVEPQTLALLLMSKSAASRKDTAQTPTRHCSTRNGLDLFSLSGQAATRIVLQAPQSTPTPTPINESSHLKQLQQAAQGHLPCSRITDVGVLLCHIVRWNCTATALVATCATVPAATASVSAMLMNSFSRLQHMQLCATPLPTWPLLQERFRPRSTVQASGRAARNRHTECWDTSCLRINGRTLQDVDVAFIATMLCTEQARGAVTAVDTLGDPQVCRDRLLQLASAVAALPLLMTIQGISLCALSPKQAVLHLDGATERRRGSSDVTTWFGAAGGAVLAKVIRRHCGMEGSGTLHCQRASPPVPSVLAPKSSEVLFETAGASADGTNRCTRLRALELSSLALGPVGSDLVANALNDAVSRCGTLASLHVAGSLPGVGGLTAWSALLANPAVGHSLLSIDLSHNQMTDRQLEGLLAGLASCKGEPR